MSKLTDVVHKLSHDEGRYWAYLALDLPLGTPGAAYHDPSRPSFLNPWPAHWANQPDWAAT